MPVNERGHESTQPDHRPKQFGKAAHVEAELSVEPAFRIGKPRQVVQSIGSKERFISIVLAHMYQDNSAAGRFDLCSLLGDIGESFATERASCVSQKNDQSWLWISQLVEPFTVI